MPTTASPPRARAHRPLTRNQSIALVFCCTLFGAAAQVLMKSGLTQAHGSGWVGYVTSVPLLAGYGLYAVNTVLMVFALRDGELSILYPIIALTYVWVTMLSLWLFHESLNALKLLGVAIVVLGVAELGRSPKA